MKLQPSIAHAPLPWTWIANSWQFATIYDADNLPVCRFDLEDWPVTEDNQDDFEKAQDQLVALVVEAMNSHASLKASIQESEAREAGYKKRIEELEHPFRAVDELDWRHLLSFIPDSGHGKFWKVVFAEIRSALHPKSDQ